MGIVNNGSVNSGHKALYDVNQLNKLDQLEQTQTNPKKGFMTFLEESVNDVNQQNKIADKMAADIATGKSENLHETMLAVSHAELSLKMMVQVRNKVLEAYQDVMRMQV